MCLVQNFDNLNEVHPVMAFDAIVDKEKCKVDKEWKEDLLAVFTRYTKIFLYGICGVFQKFQTCTFYKILTNTTQPAHVITALSVLVVAHLLIPKNSSTPIEQASSSPLWGLLYLGSFSMHLGAQIWMTFVSGLSLYFSIPRHTFGCVQKVLFPKYFLLNAVLSFITLTMFLKTNNKKMGNTQITTQAISMIVCFLIELIIRLYFTTPLLALITSKNQIEKDAGVGQEVGEFNPKKLLNNNDYMEIHKSFRKVHMTIAIGNVITMGCTMLHLFYLSQKISSL